MIRVPDWAFENAAGQEMRGMGQDADSYHPGLYLTEAEVITCLRLLLTSFNLLKFGYKSF